MTEKYQPQSQYEPKHRGEPERPWTGLVDRIALERGPLPTPDIDPSTPDVLPPTTHDIIPAPLPRDTGGLHGVWEGLKDFDEHRTPESLAAAETALDTFPGVGKHRLQRALTIAAIEGLGINDALDIVNNPGYQPLRAPEKIIIPQPSASHSSVDNRNTTTPESLTIK